MGALLRGIGLGAAPLTGEEKWTLVQASGFSFIDTPPLYTVVDTDQLSRWTSVREVLHRIAAFDQPLFVLLSRLSLRLMGPSEWSLRLVPAVCGALTPLLLYLWARRTVGDIRALLAAALLALHPFHVDLSRFGRVYSLAIAFLLAGYLIPHHWRGRPVFSPIAVFLGMQPLTHMLSGFALIPHVVSLRLVGHVRRRHLLASACVGLLILACALPFGLADSILSEHVYTGVAHSGVSGVMGLTLPSLISTGSYSVTALLAVNVENAGLRTRSIFPVVVVLGLLCARGLLQLKGPTRLVFLVGSVLPTLVAVALCFTYDHLVPLIPRYAVWSVPFLMVLLSLGLLSLRHGASLAAVVLALYLALDVIMLRHGRPGYKLGEAAAVGACGTLSTPIEVKDALDAYTSATARRRGVIFTVVTDLKPETFKVLPEVACRPQELTCLGAPVCRNPTSNEGTSPSH